MKRLVLRLMAFSTLLVLILPACSLAAATGPVNPLAGTDGSQRVYLPVIGKNTSFLSPIIPATTNVLDAATIQQFSGTSVDGATETFLFDHTTPVLQALAPARLS